jgi:hypothetical protein
VYQHEEDGNNNFKMKHLLWKAFFFSYENFGKKILLDGGGGFLQDWERESFLMG